VTCAPAQRSFTNNDVRAAQSDTGAPSGLCLP